MKKTLVPIRDFAGLNRLDGADRVLDNQLFLSQNFYPATKGLLYKRAGSTSDLTASQIPGCAKITGLHRHYSGPYGTSTLYHCEPDSSSRAKATTDLTLSELTVVQLAALGLPAGDLFGSSGLIQTLKVAYTFVGQGLESQMNSTWRVGYVTTLGTNAWDQPGHQSIKVANNQSGIQIQAPVFPAGVASVNLFASLGSASADTNGTVTGNTTSGSATVGGISSVGVLEVGTKITGSGIPANTTITAINTFTNQITISNNATATASGVTLSIFSTANATQMTYIGTITQSGGTFNFRHFINAYTTRQACQPYKPGLTVLSGGSLKAGTYYVALASLCDSNTPENQNSNYLNDTLLSTSSPIVVSQDNSAIQINLSSSFNQAGCGVTNFSSTVTMADTSQVQVGMGVSGTGVVPGTYVTVVNSSTQITLSQVYSGTTGTITLTFSPNTRSAYIFIGTQNATDHPMVWAGNMSLSESPTITSIPDNCNAQSFNVNIPFPTTADSAQFAQCIGSCISVETFRVAYLMKKSQAGILTEILPSRSLRNLANTNNYDPVNGNGPSLSQQLTWAYGYIRSNSDLQSAQVTGNSITGSSTLTGMSTTSSLVVGAPITGFGMAAGTTIASIVNGTTLTISQPATGTNSGTPFTTRQTLNYNKTIYPVNFAYFNGLSYFVNGVDIPWKTDGKTLAVITPRVNTLLPPYARFIKVWKQQLLLAGADALNHVYASNALDARSWYVAGGGAGTTGLRFVTIGDLQGDNPTAIGVFSRTTDAINTPDSYFLSFKKHGCWMLNNFPDPTYAGNLFTSAASMSTLSGRVGCVAPRSIVSTPLGVLFLGSDGDIYMIRGGGEPYRIGTKVKSLFAHLVGNDTLMSQVTAVYHDDHYKICYPSSSGSTGNDAQLWADLRTMDNSPITWSGPHTGINVGAQTVYVGESDNGWRVGLLSTGTGSVRLDDTSTYQDLGTPITSVLQTKTFRFKSETTFKRYLGALLDAYYDTSLTHSVLVEFFADEFYAQSNQPLSSGGGTYDSSQFDQALWSDAFYQGIPFLIGDMNLVGRTLYVRVTHSNPNPFILAALVLPIKPERRSIV